MIRAYLIFILLIISACSPKQNELLDKINQDTTDHFVIAFGSCNKHDLDQSYWQQIGAQKPDLWIWLGDIVYADTENMQRLQSLYDTQKNNSYYTSMIQQTKVFGIWDDHDYGLNDGGREFPKRDSSKLMLFEFLDVPEDDPSRNRKGAYQQYVFDHQGMKLKIILLDARYFRDAQIDDPSGKKRYLPNNDGTILGDSQWKWFEDQISDSDADFHIIGSGIQFLSDQHGYEMWANFPAERKRMLELLEKHNPEGCIILSGDRHIGEISKTEVSMSQGELFDITSSGLTHAYLRNSNEKEPNPYRVGSLQSKRNYGIVRLFNSDDKRAVYEIWGMKGKLLESASQSF